MKIRHPWEIQDDVLPFMEEIAPHEKKSIADDNNAMFHRMFFSGKKNACLSTHYS
jgi:hypothetical protein